MSEAPPSGATALPLFHTNIVALDPAVHASLRLDRGVGYGFSAAAEIIPIGIDEFDMAARSYPIVFSAPPEAIPLVVLGVRKGWNLFVNDAGTWMPGAYVPALVRAHPFVLIEQDNRQWIGIENDAASLASGNGLPLFDAGRPTAVLNEAVEFCRVCEAGLVRARQLGAALDEAGVLVERVARITSDTGAGGTLTGFRTVDPQRLDSVSDAMFLEWRRRAWLPAIYAHLFAAVSWLPFTELAGQQLSARQ